MARRNALKKLWSMCYLSSGGFLIYSGISIYNNNEKFYNDILMPVSRYLSPETSHSLALTLTKYKVFPRSKFVDPPILQTTFLGRKLSNPIGIAAGFDKQGEAIDGLSKMGFGIVEIGSVTPLPQPGNPKPRVFRLLEDKAIINRYGFNSDGHEKVNQRLTGVARDNGVMLGVNLGKNKESDDPINDYVSGIKQFGHLADYVVINVSSPNTPGLRNLQGKEKLRELLSALVTTRNSLSDKKPLLLVKLAPDLSPKERSEVAEILNKKECKVDGLVISNTTIQRPNLLNKTHIDEAGGLSGQPLKDMATDLIRDMFKLTKGKIPIIGVGGVFTGQDAYEKILAGASAIQIYSAFIYNGPPVISKIKSELSEHLERNGFKNVDDAVGKENLKK